MYVCISELLIEILTKASGAFDSLERGQWGEIPRERGVTASCVRHTGSAHSSNESLRGSIDFNLLLLTFKLYAAVIVTFAKRCPEF